MNQYTEEQKKVMHAWIDGAIIEYRDNRSKLWDVVVNPIWSWDDGEYRVKTEHIQNPLFMIHGKPVMRGDKLYHIDYGIVTAEFEPNDERFVTVRHQNGAVPSVYIDNLFWPDDVKVLWNAIQRQMKITLGNNTPIYKCVVDDVKKRFNI